MPRGTSLRLIRPLLLAASCSAIAFPALAVGAVPLDPVNTIVRAFDDHRIVALGEGNHGNLPGHALRLELLRDPAFRRKVRDIVVEFGNSRYQYVIDRYARGEEVAPDELRKVWQDTAQANPVWDAPIYEEFYRAVRELNAGLPQKERLRIVLGDVPFDWSAVRTVEDYNRQPQRNDAATVAIIRREVLDKGHRALVVFGDMHFLRKALSSKPGESRSSRSIVSLLEDDKVPVFSIYTNSFLDLSQVQPDTAGWQPPKIALLKGTPLGAAPFVRFSPSGTLVNGKWVATDPALSPPMEEMFDALLYLGPPSSIRQSLPSPALCRDEDYLAMRFFRMELVGMGAVIEQAKQYCRTVLQ